MDNNSPWVNLLRLRHGLQLSEADAWATLRPDPAVIEAATATARRDAREFVRSSLTALPPTRAMRVAALVADWLHTEPLRLPDDLFDQMNGAAARALDAALHLYRAPAWIPQPQGSVWSKGLSSDLLCQPTAELSPLTQIHNAVLCALRMQLKSKPRQKALQELELGTQFLSPSDVAVLHLLQGCNNISDRLREHLRRVEREARTFLSSTLTGASREVFHSLHALLTSELGTLPDQSILLCLHQLATALVPEPFKELDRLLQLLMRDFPTLSATLAADARRQGERALVRRLPCVKRLLAKPGMQLSTQ